MKALYAISLLFGILAAILSGAHGVGEVLQDGSPAGVAIDAFGSEPFTGAACELGTGLFGTSQNCFPAMTILTFLPFSIIGILTLIFSIMLGIITIQTYREGEAKVPDVPNTAPPPLKSIPYKRGQHILIGSVLILLIGGGFGAPIFGLISTIARYVGSR